MDASIGSLGMHVEVNLQGRTVAGIYCGDGENWVAGVIVGVGALGNSLTVKLDAPLGAEPGSGLFHRGSDGEDMVSVDDPARVRAVEQAVGGVPQEIAALARAGKTAEAIKRYRALNGATVDDARVALRGI